MDTHFSQTQVYAHISSDGRTQSLKEHIQSVVRLCTKAAGRLGLSSLAGLTAYLHDMGKATADFQKYLTWTAENPDKPLQKGVLHPNHAPIGARFAYKRFFCREGISEAGKRAAELVALCVYGHHAGLPDCLDKTGASPFLNGIEVSAELCGDSKKSDSVCRLYEEAVSEYEKSICPLSTLDELFDNAAHEVEKFMDARLASKLGTVGAAWSYGFLARLLLSILTDADRWDSACFEYNADPFSSNSSEPKWDLLSRALGEHLDGLPKAGSIMDKIRTDISHDCLLAADSAPGIYSLSVPTGGGKTFSSLRFALEHARRNGLDRIFYIIPYNTVLEQNAADIREALGNDADILEHHSNVIQESENDYGRYKHLTERWESRIILTSMVQFLNTLFRRENTNARRMLRLVNSVIVFDEIQALPLKCKVLFEHAVCFLHDFCGCSILLCTATQPGLSLHAQEIMKNVPELYEGLRRVEYKFDFLRPKSNEQAAQDIADMVLSGKSVLTIVNTKATAWQVYEEVSNRLRESGMRLFELRPGVSPEEATRLASESDTALCVHLSTLMCAAHRRDYINCMKAWLAVGKPVCCVSTALIEAGVNISFPVVVRSLAGVPSIIQAAGRCNRNFKHESGDVYVWSFQSESLSRLPEISVGQDVARRCILEHGLSSDWMSSTEAPEKYSEFMSATKDFKRKARYIFDKWQPTLSDMLSDNSACVQAACDMVKNPCSLLTEQLRQSFRTASEEFRVIDSDTVGILVPYGEGSKIITQLCSDNTLRDEILLLRKAQAYSVNVYPDMYNRLSREGMLFEVGTSGAIALKDGGYTLCGGLQTGGAELEYTGL